MYNRGHIISAFFLILSAVFSSCSRGEFDLTESGDEIIIAVEGWKPLTGSRAALYDNESLKDPEQGGGNITLHAHVDGTDKTYIGGARVWYFKELTKWTFLDGRGEAIAYYWPNSQKLNFFAFMPDSDYDGKDGYKSKETYVTVGDYTEEKGQIFSCQLPQRVGFIQDPVPGTEMPEFVASTEIQEFIYDYQKGLTKADNPVELKFKHPFAQIEFQLAAGSYRMTVNQIIVNDICLKGTFSTAESLKTENADGWTPDWSSRQAFTAEINKRIPNEINYATPLGDPFLVLPQDGTVTFTLNATRNPDKEITQEKDFIVTSAPQRIDWEPGKKYVYTISAGNNNEEIYFNVNVAGDWSEVWENNIDVE